MPISKAPIVWIDCEMTGLDVERDSLIEVAVLVTDAELNLLDEEGLDLVIAPDKPEAVENMGDFVRTMHTTSGLLEELPAGLALDEAQRQVLDYIRSLVPEANKAPLGGNSVAMDKMFLSAYMPEVIEHLHYRLIDVSTLKELARRWYPRAFFNAPAKEGGHRALADIRESIRELRYYREAMMLPDPGYDTARLRKISAKY